MQPQRLRSQVALLCLCLLTATEQVTSAASFWQESAHKAMQLQRTDGPAAIEMYKLAIKDAASENAPVEKQLGLLLNCGNLMYSNIRSDEAVGIFDQGAALAEKNGLKNWQARFLLMKCRNAHELVRRGLAKTNDPTPGLKALELRPGVPNTTSDFRVTALQGVGDAYLDNKDFPNAEKYLRMALQEADRLPDEQTRVDEITRSYLKLRIQDGKYASATALLLEFAESHPSVLWATKEFFFDTLSDADPELKPIQAKIDALIAKRDFAELDAYSEELARQQKPLPRGNEPIDVMMGILDVKHGQPEAAFKSRIDFLNEWVEKNPKSTIAKTALAAAMTGYAWFARGSGFGNTVTRQGWLLFDRRLDQAWRILSTVMTTRPNVWYPAAQRVALGKGWNRAQYDGLVAEAQKAYPKYNSPLFRKAYWLQPKWHGEPGEATKFILAECAKHPGIEGDILYAQFAWSLDFSFSNVIKEAGFDWARVKRGFAAILQRFPNSVSSRAELAYLSTVVGDKATALSAFAGQPDAGTPIKMRPRGYMTLVETANKFREADKRPEAIAAYTKAIALDPKAGEAYYERAEMNLMTNHLDDALSDINKCLSMFPSWGPALAKRGRIRNVREEYPESIADIEAALALDPSSADGLSTLGHNYDALGDHQRALNVANADWENSEQTDPTGLYYAYQDRGLVWSNAHQYEQAYDDLTKGIRLRGTWSQLWAYLAYIYAATNQIDKAEQAATILLKLESFPPRGYRLRAEMYRAGGLWDKALADYETSTRLEPTYGPGFWQRAVTKMALGKYESAQSDLNKSVELVPTSALAYSYLALADELVGKSDLAKTHISKAFSLTPKLPMNFVNRARIELHQGDLEGAAKDCREALAIDPYSADAYATAADILSAAGKTEQAQAFQKTATAMWWQPWAVRFPTPKTIREQKISIDMPQLQKLEPASFTLATRDAAP